MFDRAAMSGLLSRVFTGLCIAGAVMFAPHPVHADPGTSEHLPPIHHAAFFLGFANHEAGDHRATDLAIGAEFEWRLPAWHYAVGFGPVIEVTMADHSALTSLGAAYLHPWRGVKVFAGAGLERIEGENHSLLRGGMAYDVHLGDGGCVTPIGSVELVDHDTVVVAGMTFGYAF